MGRHQPVEPTKARARARTRRGVERASRAAAASALFSDSAPDAAADAAEQKPSRRGRTARVLLMVALVVSTALVVGLGVTWARILLDDDSSSATNQVAVCDPQTLRVTADPTIAPALEQIVAARDAADAECLEVDITSQPSAETAAALVVGATDPFDLWVPDTAMWADAIPAQAEAAGTTPIELTVGDPIASTPVVFAATAPVAAALDPATVGWSTIVARAIGVVLPDPATSAASTAGLLALQASTGGDARAFTAIVLGLARVVAPTTDAAFAASSASPTPAVTITTEQAVVAHNASSDAPLQGVYPTDLTPALAYSLVTPTAASAASAASVSEFERLVLADRTALAAHGLRDSTGSTGPSGDGVASRAVDVQLVDGGSQVEITRTWRVLTAPSRMLSLDDVSGSMNESVSPGVRRIDLFEQAAVAAVRSMSSNSSISTWVFSSRRLAGQDWQEVVPFGRLDDPAHLQKTIDAVNGLDRLVGGGTGLYDSVLAAVTYMHQTYDPNQVNAVLLNTDGKNDDDEGLTLPELITQLNAMNDPSKPVPVIAVGYGPDTDQDALQQIAVATEGAAYQALRPADIGTVLVDAITQRGCRPNCG